MGLLSGLGGLLGGGSGLGLGLGVLGGLMGSKSKNYGSVADLRAGKSYLGQLGQIDNSYGDLASQGLNQYAGDNQSARAATQNYADFLGADPYTDSYSTQSLANATNGANQAYSKAGADLTNSLAQRGISNSSVAAGALANLAQGKAQTYAGAQNALAQQKMGLHASHLQALTSLLGGQAQNDYSKGLGALGQQSNIAGRLGSSYLGLGQQEQQQQAQYDNGTSQGLGGLLGGLGAMYGESQYNRAQQPQTTTFDGQQYPAWAKDPLQTLKQAGLLF